MVVITNGVRSVSMGPYHAPIGKRIDTSNAKGRLGFHALALRTGSEISTVLAQGTIWTQVPQTIKITLEGRLTGGAMACDLDFRLAADFAAGSMGPVTTAPTNFTDRLRIFQFQSALTSSVP